MFQKERERKGQRDWYGTFFRSFCRNYCKYKHNCGDCPIESVPYMKLKSIPIRQLIEMIEKGDMHT